MNHIYFELSNRTIIGLPDCFSGAAYARNWLLRDLTSVPANEKSTQRANAIELREKSDLLPEQYRLEVSNRDVIHLYASDTLGAIYGLLHISREFLRVENFWFWYETSNTHSAPVLIPFHRWTSSPAKIKLRGWFINDEVLLRGWPREDKWERVFETLLRCGGNMVIPGTDKSSHENRALAKAVGLYLTHHHAEPLGAEMFSRVYPDKKASYSEFPDLFETLWAQAIEKQNNGQVIWNLGFRGQGDHPFWEEDERYQTSGERGKLISDIIEKQYWMVKSKCPEAICCTNLYGEIMELYQHGHLTLPDDLILIWADNGFGKMVSRRQWNHNPRIYSLPAKGNRHNRNGVYYHVTFYDLQASNHLTPFPNPPDMMLSELDLAYENGVRDFLIVNCGNVRPHTFHLQLIGEWWSDNDTRIDIDACAHRYVNRLFTASQTEIKRCYSDYVKCHVAFGDHDDEHAGEQFYHYCVRDMVSPWMKGAFEKPHSLFAWLGHYDSLTEQIRNIKLRSEKSAVKWGELKQRIDAIGFTLPGLAQRERFYDLLGLYVDIHAFGCQGLVACCQAMEFYQNEEYPRSFARLTTAIEKFSLSQLGLHRAEHGKWKGFFDNDCLTNIKLTIECLVHLRGFIRMTQEPDFYHGWAKAYLMPLSESKISLLSNSTRHLEDDELGHLLESYFLLREKDDL